MLFRSNMYNASEISGDAAHGYSSGTAIQVISDLAKAKLPKGFGIDWAGISKDEVARGNQAIYIFLICLVFVYLLLAAQYESFILPFPSGHFPDTSNVSSKPTHRAHVRPQPSGFL